MASYYTLLSIVQLSYVSYCFIRTRQKLGFIMYAYGNDMNIKQCKSCWHMYIFFLTQGHGGARLWLHSVSSVDKPCPSCGQHPVPPAANVLWHSPLDTTKRCFKSPCLSPLLILEGLMLNLLVNRACGSR